MINSQNYSKRLIIALWLSVVVFLFATTGYFIQHATTHLPPNTLLDSTPVGNLTRQNASTVFLKNTPSNTTITLFTDEKSISSPSAQINYRAEPLKSMENVIPQSFFDKIIWYIGGYFEQVVIPVHYSFDDDKVEEMVFQLNSQVYQEPSTPSATIGKSGDPSTITISAGELGKQIDFEKTFTLIEEKLATGNTQINIPTLTVGKKLSEEEVALAKSLIEKIVGKSIIISTERFSTTINDQTLTELFTLPDQLNHNSLKKLYDLWELEVGASPIEPELKIDEQNNRVISFTPPRNGRSIDNEKMNVKLDEAVKNLINNEEKSLMLILETQEKPPSKSLAELNSLGINERIGFGESYYSGSIPNRVFNVNLTSQKITNALIAPGEVFSFNKALGEVSSRTGFKSAYVIKGGRTELGDGGGVCQVSTTIFRATLDAGLEIVKRLPHSYRVSYYELGTKPGLDATVYTGETDFRFKNDTSGYILLHSVADSEKKYMYVELYGTSDGRSTKIVEHATWDATKAPAPQYFPDPNLPAGKLVQIDWPAGGIKARVVNEVYNADGSLRRKDVFTSNYKPWSAKYLQGTGGI